VVFAPIADSDEKNRLDQRGQYRLNESDLELIAPTEIRHHAEEIVSGDVVVERYNFIDYHFEKHDAYCRARAYLDEIEKVSIFGPHSSRDSFEVIEAVNLWNEVLDYLKRRYLVIDTLGENGYVNVWIKDESP
jgi:hypothetical protein